MHMICESGVMFSLWTCRSSYQSITIDTDKKKMSCHFNSPVYSRRGDIGYPRLNSKQAIFNTIYNLTSRAPDTNQETSQFRFWHHLLTNWFISNDLKLMSIPYIQHLFYGSSFNQQNCQRNNARFPLNIFEKEGKITFPH